MPYETTKNRVRKISDSVNIDFYQPKAVLSKYGWTQNRLAEKLGASVASINGIINGRPSIAQVKLLAETIGCSFFEFFDASIVGNPVRIVNGNNTEYVVNGNEIECPSCGKHFALNMKVNLTEL